MRWQDELSRGVRTVEALAAHLPLDDTEMAQLGAVIERYPMAITPYYLSLIDPNDPDDPIRRMAVPSAEEAKLTGSFDTSGEMHNTVLEGLQHKYAQTGMMLSTNTCSMYCRHCFRKRLVGLSRDEVARQADAVVAYVAEHEEMNNVLVSGGDALLNSNAQLEDLLGRLAMIDHLDFIRIGTRVPVVFPSRIVTDQALLDILARVQAQKQLMLVTQFNHPREITEQSTGAVQAVRALGIPVMNQTVLLRGVNDDAAVLGGLMQGLTAIGVLPYYVFQCRPVTGVKTHFQVPLRRGAEIVRAAKMVQNGVGKSFRYCMSHVTGKLEILGMAGAEEMLFQYHEAVDGRNLGRLFTKPVTAEQAWLDDAVLLEA